eukprot:c9631_g1_i1 orf=569-6229(-)
MTIPKPATEDMQSKKSQNVEAPLKNASKIKFTELYKLLHQQDQEQDMNAVNGAEWDAIFHEGVDAECTGEHVDGLLEDQAQRPLPTCTQESAYPSPTVNGGPVDQFRQFNTRQVIHPEGQEREPIHTQNTYVSGNFARSHGEPSNYITFNQGNLGQVQYNLHTSGTSHPGMFMHMLQQAEMQGRTHTRMQGIDQSWQPYGIQSQECLVVPEEPRQEREGQLTPGACNMDQDSLQDNLAQNLIGFRSGCDMAGTSLRGPAAYPQRQFPFEVPPSTELWSGCDSTASGPCMESVPGAEAIQSRGSWTQDAHHRFPSDVGTFMQGQPMSNIQGPGFSSPFASNNTIYSARQIPARAVVQNGLAIPQQWNLTYNSYGRAHGASYNPHTSAEGVNPLTQPSPGCTPSHLDSLQYHVGAYAPNSVHHVATYGSFNTDLTHHTATINGSPSEQASSLERVSYDDAALPSNSQNLEGLDAHCSTATGGHTNQSPSACSNDLTKTGLLRLSAVRMKIRKGDIDSTGIGNDKLFVPEMGKGQINGTGNVKERLSSVRSEMRKGGLLVDGEPQQKQKRKKIRCRVQKDITKRRGRRGFKNGKPKDMPGGVELQGDEGSAARDGKIAEAGLSSITEATIFSEIEEGTTQVSHDGQAGFALVCPEGTVYSEECGSAGSRFSNNRLEMVSWHNHSNAIVDYGTGHDTEKPPLVDFLALSDERHRAGAKDLAISSNMNEPKRLVSFGCQDLVLYDQAHQQSQSKELPLCLFSGETSSTGSTDIVPVRGSFGHLPLAKVTPDDNLQLVLYNQKRDIVVSKFRTYKKIRAKVQLDPESQRVWLQLENGAGPQADNDPGRARHWEKERGDMKRKVELFIKKMHNVQGDRKFSPWKGSIVDSVVGAFLTQNVSDHLSSSAFMSVASRFPPVSRKKLDHTLVPCPDVIDTFPFERPCEVDILPSIMERVYFSSEEELALSNKGVSDCHNRLYVDESTAAETECGEVTGLAKLPIQLDDIRLQFPCSNAIEGMVQGYSNALIDTPDAIEGMVQGYSNALTDTPDSQFFEKKQQDHHLLASDDEHNSTCTMEEDASNGDGSLEELSGAFRQQYTIRNSKARRMLNFGTDIKQQQPELCATLEPDKQVSLALMQHDSETASDNISDQQSESESAVGSSGSVHSVQDSNFQLSIVQEGNLELSFQANIVQENSRELHVAAVVPMDSKNSKKRPMSLSSISGMERAQLEANQKGRKKNHHQDWESVRKQALGLPSCAKENLGVPEPRSSLHEDSVNWDAVRLADLGELADTIKERGMHHVLSGRIKAFLTSVHEDHGSVDLEWLRNLSSEKAREFLMSIHGLGVKSVECIRLLTLHHLAFPVDTNVGRICVRLGWVPIEPLPEEVQLHLVELYPIQETIQKYLWPRLCTLDQRTLYELHYQLITFGKVFCTKSKPNCNACPLRTECKHFASAYASAKPLLTGPEQDESNRICSGAASKSLPVLGMDAVKTALLEYPQDKPIQLSLSREAPIVSEIDNDTGFSFGYQPPPFGASYGDFYVEEPASPERVFEEEIMDIEDMGKQYIYNNYNDYSLDLLGDNLSLDHPDQSQVSVGLFEDAKSVNIQSTYIASAQLSAFPSLPSKDLCCSPHQSSNSDPFTKTPCCKSQSIISCDTASERCTDLVVEVAQNAIVAVPEAAQIPAPKLKSIGRLRTIHYVYEIPDGHSLLKTVEVDAREKDDPCSYLLAIWSPGETPESQQEINELCRDDSSAHTAGSPDETVSGTLLIPCRTAMHGSFPLNGTYFQVNEVFADHASSLDPLQVPRSLIWSLRRRFVYFGTSVPNIFKGLSTDEIKDCFWRGHVCVRGFDRKSRAPKPLVCRLHFPISKQPQKTSKSQGRKKDEKAGFSSTTSHT